MKGNKKKILFIPGIVRETIGGAELQASYIAEALQKKGHEIFGIYIHPSDYATPKYNGLILHRSKLTLKLNVESFYAKKIYNFIMKIKPDIIYNRAFMPSLAPAAYYCQKNPCKTIWHIAHNRSVEKFHFHVSKHLHSEIIDQAIKIYSLGNIDCVISQTKHQATLLKKNYKKQTNMVIPNFHPLPKEKIKKKKVIQIVWVANLKNWKQPELFIKLASNLQKYSNAKFIMIGRSGNSKWMEKQAILQQIKATPNLHWMGSLPIEKVNEILAESHIFVNTSIYEGFPNTFIQAWMRKVPVLSLNADIDSVLEKGQVGFICHSFSNLLAYTEFLIESPSMREKMGGNAQNYAFDNFTIDANMPKILSVFQR